MEQDHSWVCRKQSNTAHDSNNQGGKERQQRKTGGKKRDGDAMRAFVHSRKNASALYSGFSFPLLLSPSFHGLFSFLSVSFLRIFVFPLFVAPEQSYGDDGCYKERSIGGVSFLSLSIYFSICFFSFQSFSFILIPLFSADSFFFLFSRLVFCSRAELW